MPYTRAEGFLSLGPLCVQQSIPNMTEWKKKKKKHLKEALRFQTYQNPLFSLQTNLGEAIT